MPRPTRMHIRLLTVAVLLLATGCRTAGSETERDVETWSGRTARLLEEAAARPLTERPEATLAGGVQLLLPPGTNYDSYTAALAVRGLGTADGLDAGEITQRLDRSLSADELEQSIAGPIYSAREIEQALRILDPDRPLSNAVARLVEDASSVPAAPDQDPFEVLYLTELADAGTPGIPLDAWAEAFVAGATSGGGCSSDPYTLGALLAVAPAAVACTSADVTRAFEAASNGLGVDEVWDLSHCERFLAMVRLAPHAGQGATEVAAAASASASDRLRTGALMDPVACAAVLRNALVLAGQPVPPLAPALVDHLVSVAALGGEAVATDLDVGSTALAVRLHRLVSDEGDTPVLEAAAEIREQASGTDRVDLDLSFDEPLEPGSLEAALALAEAPGADGRATTVALRALLSLGDDACDLPAAFAVTDRALTDFDDRSGASARLAPAAQAALVARRCSRVSATTEQRAAAILTRARATLDPVADPEGQEALPRVWDALAAICALDPKALPDGAPLWQALRSSVLDAGGAVDPELGAFSIERSFLLASIGAASPRACERTGVLG